MLTSFTENFAKIMKEKRDQMVPSLLTTNKESDFDMSEVIVSETEAVKTP